MTPTELFENFSEGFPARKFSAGLLIAFIDMLKHLNVPGSEFKDFDAVLARYPRQTKTRAGKSANTLIVQMGPESTDTISLRPFYNDIERYFRSEKKRYDYPSCAPHATQAWGDYKVWLDAICTYTSKQCEALRASVCDFILSTLADQSFDPASIFNEPPLFLRILTSFEIGAQSGEPTGAAFQGIVFGFLRADNPHLQIEISKVRTGSKRLERVGDIDAWDGTRLALSSEVKQFQISDSDADDFEAFADEIKKRGALGIVGALEFSGEARRSIEARGLRALSRADMTQIVALWDPIKQRTAVASLEYYFGHVEKNSSLTKRLADFLVEHKNPPSLVAPPAAEPKVLLRAAEPETVQKSKPKTKKRPR